MNGKRSSINSIGSTSPSLLERVKQQDQSAWKRLIRLYGPLIYHWCQRAGLQQTDAADIFQDVCCSLVRGLATFQRDPERSFTFRRWLSAITHNRIRDYFRRLHRLPIGKGGSSAHQQFQQLENLEEESADTQQSEQHLIVHGALDLIRSEFSEHTWQAFWRVAIEGHATDDVARDLQTSASAVRQANYRVRRRLREELEDLFE